MGELTIPLLQIDQLEKEIDKEISKLNKSFKQIDLMDSYGMFYSMTTKYTLFLAACGMIQKVDYILANRANLNKYQKDYTMHYIRAQYNETKSMTKENTEIVKMPRNQTMHF